MSLIVKKFGNELLQKTASAQLKKCLDTLKMGFIKNGLWRSPIEEINRYLSPEEELEFEKNSIWRNSDLNAGCNWSYFEIVHRLKIWMSPNHKNYNFFQRQKCHFFGLMDSPWSCASQNSLYAFGSLKPWTLSND